MRAEIFFLEDAFGFNESARGRVLMGEILKIAFPSLIADRTIERMIGEDELEHRAMGIIDHGGRSAYAHSFVYRCATGGLKFGHLFDFDQTHAAIGIRFELRMIAEMRNHDADATRRFDDQRSFRDLDRHPINRQANYLCSGSRHRAHVADT